MSFDPSGLLAQAQNHLQQARVAEALQLFYVAESAACDPNLCAAGRWTCYMLTGDYAAAWRESEMIETLGCHDPHRFWDGRSLAGKDVILRCLHGLGDTLQFIRYVPLIQAQARTLTVEAQPKLKRLLQKARIAEQVITWGDPAPFWNQQMEVNELPRIFRTTLASIPQTTPYLHLEESPQNITVGGSLRVGIAWSASNFDPSRSIPVHQMAQLFDVPGVQFFSLQAGTEYEQIAPWADQVKALTEASTCILQVACEMVRLDLIITVDTMTAHLSGALGRPTWTLLPLPCDWRWMLNRNDTPWYPTMRLFRQPSSGAWLPVIQQVRAELLNLAAAENLKR